MGLSPGTQIGSCEIREPLGVGGMGEVWRGHDTKLGRDVAIKALPDEFARDTDRMARFEREAQLLAALNHPNLAIIHELKEVDGAKYLILELVEGETLAERVARGTVPVREALNIAMQIAAAVQAAHDKGIVHRDLKPANIKVTPEGRVKVLDFGLAKVHEAANAPQHISHSPTMLPENTAEGVILGTAAYMSPEQARGKDVDRRADIWAFGCILYEMLTGRQAFPVGETLSDTLAGILVNEPDWKALPAGTPSKIRDLIERCLRKDERRRIRDLGDSRIAIEETRGEFEALEAAVSLPAAQRRRERIFTVLTAIFLVLAVGIAARLFFAAPPPSRTTRLDTPIPVGMINGFYVSPDGRKLAFVTRPLANARIWVRSIESATAEPIPSTEGIAAPDQPQNINSGQNNSMCWSADSQYIAFVAEGKLKTVAATGGPATSIATLPQAGNYFCTWNNAGDILLGPSASSGPLLRVAAAPGGKLEPLTQLDAGKKETSHRFPHFLPDGRHYLFLSTGSDARDRMAYVGSLDSKDRHPLPGIAAEVKYSDRHLVFVRDGALMAQPFDLDSLQLTGDAFTILDKFSPPPELSWPFSVSLNGVLTYRASPEATQANVGNAELAWYDSKGTRLGIAAPEADYPGPELSPDGKYVAFAKGMPADITWLDIEKKLTTKLTTDPAHDQNPRWSPDGKTIAFDSVREGGSGIYMRALGVTSEDKLIFKTDNAKSVSLSDWSRDGKYLVFVADNDIFALRVMQDPKSSEWTAEGKPITVTKTPFTEALPRISPDNRWIAYVSNQSTRDEIWIRSFPDPGTEQQVSSGAGRNTTTAQAHPHWSFSGKEVYYFSGVGGSPQFMSVSVTPVGTSLNASAPQLLLPHPAARPPFSSVFSVTRDGRFLLQLAPIAGTVAPTTFGQTASAAAGSTTTTATATIITNWAAKTRSAK
jgi:Tol biopolymer transport system component